MRVYETLNSEITKISMDGGESQGRESERGSVIKTDRQAFPWHPSRSTRRQTTDKPSPGTPLEVPGDRLQTSLPLAPLSKYQETDYRQAFPWHPSRGTRRQTTDKPSPGTPLEVPGDRLQTSLPLAPLSGYQETDYRQAFPWHPSRSTRRQTRQTSLPLAPLSEYQETD